MKDFFKLPISHKTLFVAILVRLLVMPFFFHPDVKTTYFQTSFLKSGVVNIYDYLIVHRQELPLKEEFVYFPLTYLFLGGYQAVFSPPFGANFDNWLGDASASMIENAKVYRYLFLMKFPYLILDILMAFLLASFFKEEDKKKRTVMLWLFNPFTIILIYVFSNIDLIPAFLTVASLLLAYRRKLVLSSLILGIAAGFKVYPLLFLPFIALKSVISKKGVGVIFTPLIFLTLLITPFWSKAFQSSALVSGLTTRIVQGGISLGFGESIFIPVLLISALIFFAIQKRKDFDLASYCFLTTIFLFSFIHFHIQWLLWAAPFAVIVLIKRPDLKPTLLILTLFAFSIPLFYNDKFMSFSLFVPISGLFSLVPAPFAIIQRFFDPYIVQGIFHSLLAGGSLVLGWQLIHHRIITSDGGRLKHSVSHDSSEVET